MEKEDIKQDADFTKFIVNRFITRGDVFVEKISFGTVKKLNIDEVYELYINDKNKRK